jgi:hypothetical protein
MWQCKYLYYEHTTPYLKSLDLNMVRSENKKLNSAALCVFHQ